MSRRLSCFLFLLVVLSALGARAQEEPAPFVENPVVPEFVELSSQALTDAVSVRSGRSHAVFGYNMPEVVLQLPELDNSVYAKTTFDDPVLVGPDGEAVEYERETGIYDHETHTDEIRMGTPDGGPVSYAQATGTVRVRYPIAIMTRRASVSDEAALTDLGVAVEGRKVRVNLGDAVPEEASFAPISMLRAFDETGRMIAREGGWSGGMVDGVSYREYEYRADIASVEVDRVEEWIGLSIDYELPAAPMRDPELAGTLPEPDPLIASAPAETFSVEVVELIPQSVLGFAADLSPGDVAVMLEEIGYRSIDDEALLRAATEGSSEAIRLLLAAGISPSAKVEDETPLLRAASFADPDVIMLLVEAGADVSARDGNDSTALIRLANRCGQIDAEGAARAMIDAGIDVNAKARGTATALMMADVMQCSGLADMLRKAGAEEWQ